MQKKEYRPISCDFHSELELLALRQTKCNIVHRNNDGEVVELQDRIKDLYTRKGEEFLLLPNGKEIRLDQLISVDGKILKDYC